MFILNALRDQAIAQLVASRLRDDQSTCDQTIDVIVVGGQILLVGCCDTLKQKVDAQRIALGTCGVSSVIDNIRVRRVPQSI